MMTPEKWSLVLCMSLLSIFVPIAKAGGMEGGGGKSIVCRDSAKKIISTELLDLFEGRAVYQLNYQEKTEPWQVQGREIITSSGIPSWTDPAEIAGWFENAAKNLVLLPPGVTLLPVSDSLEPILPPLGCAIEQTINYQSDNRILVNSEIWSAMSQTQQAALILHEATYRHLRNYGETDSRRARHFVAFLFSGGKVQNTWPDDSNTAPVICGPLNEDHLGLFVTKIDGPSGPTYQIYFTSLNRLLLSRSSIEIPPFPMNDSQGHPIDLLGQLVNPTIDGLWYNGGTTKSNFEAGDRLNIRFSKGPEGKLIPHIYGTSIVDESSIDISLKCHQRL